MAALIWNDIKFYKNKSGYYFAHIALHKEMWKLANNKPVPEGHHIHHKDGDLEHNEPDNLECLLHSEHTRHHMLERYTHPEALEERARQSTKAWKKTPFRVFHCLQCGKKVRSRCRKGVKFCSSICTIRWKRANIRGIRACNQCGKHFSYAYGDDPKFCSQTCVNLGGRWPRQVNA